VWNNQLYALTTSNFDTAIRERADAVLARRNPHFANLLDLSRLRDGRPAPAVQ
jgi:hypothetical protein